MLVGRTAIEELGPVIKAHGVKKILVTYGCGSVKRNGVYDRVMKTLKDNGIEHIELSGIQPNPLIEKVYEGIKLLKDKNNHLDAVLALGGGSVIDSSKAMCTGALLDADIYDMLSGKIPPSFKMMPLYTVLTISATGSEQDAGGVITVPDKKEKLGNIFGEQPVASAIDPSVQLSLPWKQVMCGAVDSLSHLMESMWTGEHLSITTRQINFNVQRSIIKSMEIMVKDPTNYDAKENFVWAVSLALNGFVNMGSAVDNNVHLIEHSLSAYKHGIAHAEGLAIISTHYYPYLYNKGIRKDDFDEWAREVMGEKDGLKGLEKFKEMTKSWKGPITLKDVGITEGEIEELVKSFDHHSKMWMTSQVFQLTNDDVRNIYKSALN